MQKKKKGNNYFSKETEDAIIRFQEGDDPLEFKKKLFVEKIEPSFKKLIEYIIYIYKFNSLGNIEVLKNDCMSFLFEAVAARKYDKSKGHKAFSYFNVITRNWFIQRVKNHKKKARLDVEFDQDVVASLEKNNDESAVISYEDDLLREEFQSLLKEEIRKWRGKFEKDQERKVLEAVILLLENPEIVSIYNKKGIYMYIREITGLNTKQVVTNLTKFRKKYKFFKEKYFGGEI